MFTLPTRAIDLTGEQFFRWTVLAPDGINQHGSVMWLCRCACGAERVIDGQSLRKGTSRSCNCGMAGINTTHGETLNKQPSIEYTTFHSAKGRCTNPNNQKYPDYGGRGIEFRFESFAQFLQAVGRKPSPQHTLNRIDNDGHYEPGNVEWATPKTQGNNKRNNVLITVGDETKSIADWAQSANLNPSTIVSRIYLYKWCHKCAVTLPVIEGVRQCNHLP